MADEPDAETQDNAEVAAALGRFLMAYESLDQGLRVVLAEFMCLGITDGHQMWSEVYPRVSAVVGHLSYGAVLSSLRALWDADRMRIPLEHSLLAELQQIDELRNGVVHASWTEYGDGAAWRLRFHRHRSSYTSGPLPLSEITSITARVKAASDQVWLMVGPVEEALIRAMDSHDNKSPD